MSRQQYEGDPRNRTWSDFTISKILRDSNPLIQGDSELLALDEQLRSTAPRPEAMPRPKFKKELKHKLLKQFRKHRPKQGRS
jgi:hypothetical protein